MGREVPVARLIVSTRRERLVDPFDLRRDALANDSLELRSDWDERPVRQPSGVRASVFTLRRWADDDTDRRTF